MQYLFLYLVLVVIVVVVVVAVLVVVILFPEDYNMIHSICTTFQQFHKCIPRAVAREAQWLNELTTSSKLPELIIPWYLIYSTICILFLVNHWTVICVKLD